MADNTGVYLRLTVEQTEQIDRLVDGATFPTSRAAVTGQLVGEALAARARPPVVLSNERGERIKRRREALGWTQDELAKRAAPLTRGGLANIENGSAKIVTDEVLARIEAALVAGETAK